VPVVHHPLGRAMGGNASQEVGGVRVFKVNPGSPAAEAGLEVFFDFIVEVNGFKIDQNCQQVFAEKIQESENAQAKLTVYNARAHNTREVIVTPRKWAGNGLLGAAVRYDMADPSENHGVRVLEVFPNSPAAHAGLVPFQDYVLGTAQAVFHDIDELVETVTSSINQRMNVYVYNSEAETVREVILMPNTDWGGDGCIGCDIGTGLLHRIPPPRRSPGVGAAANGASRHEAPASNGHGAHLPTPPPALASSAPVAATSVSSTADAAHAGNMLNLPKPVYPPGMPAPPDPSLFEAPSMPRMPGTNGFPHGNALGAVAQSTAQPPQATPSIPWSPPPSNIPAVGSPAVSSPASSNNANNPQAEFPRAPPGTPMNLDEVPPPADLSAAMDPAKFVFANSLPGGAVSPPPGTPPPGNELYQPGLPEAVPPLL